MLTLPVLLSGLLLHTVADTVWWHTPGGNVIENGPPGQATCTLNLQNDNGRFAFIWDRVLPTRIIVQRNDWALPATQTAVDLRIGNATFDGSNGGAGIPALTRASAIMFVADQPVADLLTGADRVAIRTPDAAFDMALIPAKMRALMNAVHRCRAAISR
jgi:hypothetical protein